MYAYRSAIAHGGTPNFDGELAVLGSAKNANSLIREAVKTDNSSSHWRNHSYWLTSAIVDPARPSVSVYSRWRSLGAAGVRTRSTYS